MDRAGKGKLAEKIPAAGEWIIFFLINSGFAYFR